MINIKKIKKYPKIKEKKSVFRIISKKYNSFKLRYKIIALSLLMLIIPSLVLGILTLYVANSYSESNLKNLELMTTNKVASTMDYLFDEIDNLSLFLLANESLVSFMKNYSINESDSYSLDKRNVYNTFTYLMNTSKFADSIEIYDIKGNVLLYSRSHYQPLSKSEMADTIGLKGKYNTIMTLDNTSNSVNQISLLRLMRNPNQLEQSLGFIKINVKMSALNSIINDDDQNKSNYFLSKSTSKQFYSINSQHVLDNDTINSFISNSSNIMAISNNNTPYILTKAYIQSIDSVLLGINNHKEILIHTSFSFKFLLLIIAGNIFICLVLASVFSKRILSSIYNLTNLMNSVKNGDLDVRYNLEGTDEISVLGIGFNQMLDKTNELIDNIVISKNKEKESEIAALQERTNPHFLYNSLNIIYWIAKKEKAQETSILIEELTNYYKVFLTNTNKYISLKNELELLKSYIYLHQYIKSNIHLQISVDESLFECVVLRNTIQPLVENAIVHGFKNKELGNININIYRDNSSLYYEIADDGIGIDIKEIDLLLRNPEGQKGLAIKNINDRLVLLHGNQYGLIFENLKPANGTKVTVRQPFMIGQSTELQDRGKQND